MPLPFILGAAALVTAAYGAKKGYDGYQKHSDADDLVNAAKKRYNESKEIFDEKETVTNKALTELGNQELMIGKSFAEFKILVERLQHQLAKNGRRALELNIPKHKLQKIENYSYTAIGVLGSMAGAGVTGVAAGFAVYGGVMALGAASTGTAIASLSGVAATNATLAAIGGGSLATGGLGMAGGTAILGAAVAGPVLAIAGWAYNSHGEEALKNARKANSEVDTAVFKLAKAVRQLSMTSIYVGMVSSSLTSIFNVFMQYFDILKEIDNELSIARSSKTSLPKIEESISLAINNGYAVAAILVNLITTPVFKVKKNNDKVTTDKDGVPLMEKDADGSMLLNDVELDQALTSSDAEVEKYFKA